MTTTIHITALDGVINVNSLFTLAVFIGLAWNPSAGNDTLTTTCVPSRRIAQDLISYHVYSFSSFLFSSLVALALKQAIRISKTWDPPTGHHLPELFARVNKSLLRVGMLVSGLGSVCGCLFLMLALINVVQFKLGTLACGSGHAIAAIVPLVILVPLALVIYICVVLYAFTL